MVVCEDNGMLANDKRASSHGKTSRSLMWAPNKRIPSERLCPDWFPRPDILEKDSGIVKKVRGCQGLGIRERDEEGEPRGHLGQ